MAIITPSIVIFTGPGNERGVLVQWGPMQNGDIGQSVDQLGEADRSIQIEGTIGTGGTVAIKGSNDGVNYRPLHDPLLNLLNLTTVGITHMMEITRLLRPEVIAGDGTTSITVSIFMRRTSLI